MKIIQNYPIYRKIKPSKNSKLYNNKKHLAIVTFDQTI